MQSLNPSHLLAATGCQCLFGTARVFFCLGVQNDLKQPGKLAQQTYTRGRLLKQLESWLPPKPKQTCHTLRCWNQTKSASHVLCQNPWSSWESCPVWGSEGSGELWSTKPWRGRLCAAWAPPWVKRGLLDLQCNAGAFVVSMEITETIL